MILFVILPTQLCMDQWSGKIEGIVLPWIVELINHGASVATLDVKGDLYDRLLPEAKRVSCRVWYWKSLAISVDRGACPPAPALWSRHDLPQAAPAGSGGQP